MTDNQKDLAELVKTCRTNERIARQLFEIETSILALRSYEDLFERLLRLIEEKFDIPHVWISLVDDRKILPVIGILRSAPPLAARLNVIRRKTILSLLGGNADPTLVNNNLKPYYRLFPKNEKYVIRSLAVAPLVMEGKIIGSLNLGDYGEKRFVPSMDTFFLSRLAVIFSLCLMNLIDRERLASLAARDELTGLFNRRELDEALKRAFSSHQRHKKDMALLFIDCDDLKKVNDTHGHDCGDALIRSVAEEIMRIIRKEDMAFRYGGDEFVVLLPDNTESGARHIARRLKAFFNDNPLVWRNSLIPLSVTCGAASTEAGETKKPADLLARADEDLYRNKEERNFAAQENERRRC